MSTPENIQTERPRTWFDDAVEWAVKRIGLLPAYLLNWLLLHRLKQTLLTIITVCFVLESALVALWMVVDAHGQFIDFFREWDWKLLAFPALLAWLLIGVPATVGMAWWDLRQFKTRPGLASTSHGKWTYQFNFRRSPLRLLMKRRAVSKLRKGLITEERTSLGLQEATFDGEVLDRPVYRYLKEANQHTLIVGATGSGKSLFSMLPLIRGDMLNHRTVVMVDFKNDPKVAARLATWADELDMNFYHFSGAREYAIPHGHQCYWDPFAIAGINGKPDRIVDLRKWDDASEHYRTSWETAATNIFAMLDASTHPLAQRSKATNVNWNDGPLLQFYSAIRTGTTGITNLVTMVGATPAFQSATDFLNQFKSDVGLRKEVDNIRGILGAMIDRGYGQWMRSGPDGANINLFDLTSSDKNVILYSLDSDDSPRLAGAIGSMLMADLNSVSSLRRDKGCANFVSIYIDEAQSVQPESLENLFTKARSSKLALTIAQQSFDQIIAKSSAGVSFLNALMNTVANFLILAGSTHDSAEHISKIVGKDKFVLFSATNNNDAGTQLFKRSGSDNTTSQMTEDWIVSPREFQKLTMPGSGKHPEAIFINKSCADPAYAKHKGALARKVWLIPADEVLDEIELEQATTLHHPAAPLSIEEEDIEEDEGEWGFSNADDAFEDEVPLTTPTRPVAMPQPAVQLPSFQKPIAVPAQQQPQGEQALPQLPPMPPRRADGDFNPLLDDDEAWASR